MKIFAVIVTFNALKRNWIEKCLNSLANSSVDVLPIVVDNNSNDGTKEFLTKQEDIIYLPQNKNLGFGQANNLGIKYALENKADYVLLINQDAIVHEDALKIMTDNCDDLELVSPVHLNSDGTKLDKVFLDMLKREDQDIIQMALLNHNIDDKVEVGMVCAACWLLPVPLIRKIGGFNPIFYHYGEDDNYYHRLVYHGIKTKLVTNAYMQHDRKIQGNMKMFNKNRLRRDMLLILTNINWKIGKQCLDMIRLLKKCYTNYLPRKTYFPGLFLFECVRMMFMTNKIAKSRKFDKSIGLTWI